MMNPKDKDGNLLFEYGHPLYQNPFGHKVDGLPSFDEIAAGGMPSANQGVGAPSDADLAHYKVQKQQARAFVEAQKSDPHHEPEPAGDPSREWLRRLAKSDPDRCRAILTEIKALSEAEQQSALHKAYIHYYYLEREAAHR